MWMHVHLMIVLSHSALAWTSHTKIWKNENNSTYSHLRSPCMPGFTWMIRFKNCISTVEFLRSLPKAEAGLDLEGPGEFSGLIIWGLSGSVVWLFAGWVLKVLRLIWSYLKVHLMGCQNYLVRSIFWAHSCCRIFDGWKGIILSGCGQFARWKNVSHKWTVMPILLNWYSELATPSGLHW